MSDTAMKMETCITATLLRGRVYVFRNMQYERGIPNVVKDESLAMILEDLYDEVHDSDGEVIEKPIFEIDFEAPFPAPPTTDGNPHQKRRRLPRPNETGKKKKGRRARGSSAK